MRPPLSPLKRGALWALTFMLLGTQLAVTVSRPERGPGPLKFSSGVWTGPMLAVGSGTAHDSTWNAVWSGVMNFTSADDALSGDFSMTSNVSVSGPEVSGGAAGTGGGTISGPAGGPLMQLTGLDVEVAMTVRGISVAQNVALGSGDFDDPLEVSLVSATCNQVNGDWITPIQENMAAAGIGGSVSGYWTAVRVADLPGEGEEDYVEEMRQLIQEAFDWRTLVYTSGFIQFPFLERVLDHAEELNRRLSRSTDCDFVDEEDFMTAISAIVADALNFALENPAGLSAGDLLRMTSAALRLGIIGEGASDPDLAADLAGRIGDLADQRLEETRDLPDCGLVSANASLVLGVATLLGDTGLAANANEAFVGALSC